LSFTAEEAWGHLAGYSNESVFLNLWHQFPRVPSGSTINWTAMIALKADVAASRAVAHVGPWIIARSRCHGGSCLTRSPRQFETLHD